MNVALLTMNGKDESSNRLTTQLEEASTMELGWVPSPCDGKGSPMELETCGDHRVDEGPLDVILSAGVDPKLIPRTLRKARFKNIPVINIGASIPRRSDSSMITADFAPDDRAMAEKVDDYMIKRVEGVPRE